MVAVICAIYFVFMLLNGLALTPFILIHTSSMVSIYVLGMIAAVRLLERWTFGWWLAVVSVVLTIGLLVLAGPNLLVPGVLAVAAVVVSLSQRMRARASRGIPTQM